jgi:hypothetical protein
MIPHTPIAPDAANKAATFARPSETSKTGKIAIATRIDATRRQPFRSQASKIKIIAPKIKKLPKGFSRRVTSNLKSGSRIAFIESISGYNNIAIKQKPTSNQVETTQASHATDDAGAINLIRYQMPASIAKRAIHVSNDFDGTTENAAENRNTVSTATISKPIGLAMSFRILPQASPWFAENTAQISDKPNPIPNAVRPKKNKGAEMPNRMAARQSSVSRQCRTGVFFCMGCGSNMKSETLLNGWATRVNHHRHSNIDQASLHVVY